MFTVEARRSEAGNDPTLFTVQSGCSGCGASCSRRRETSVHLVANSDRVILSTEPAPLLAGLMMALLLPLAGCVLAVTLAGHFGAGDGVTAGAGLCGLVASIGLGRLQPRIHIQVTESAR